MVMKYSLDILSETKLTFGQYKDKTFDEIPLKYLDWLSGEFDEIQDVELRERLTQYLTHPTIAKELEDELSD